MLPRSRILGKSAWRQVGMGPFAPDEVLLREPIDTTMGLRLCGPVDGASKMTSSAEPNRVGASVRKDKPYMLVYL